MNSKQPWPISALGSLLWDLSSSIAGSSSQILSAVGIWSWPYTSLSQESSHKTVITKASRQWKINSAIQITPRCVLPVMLSIEKLSSWHLKLQCSDTFPHSCIRNIILCLITMAFWNRSKNGFLWTDFTNDRTGQRHVQWLSRVPWWQNSDLVPWLER